MTEKQLLRAAVPQNALSDRAEERLRAFLFGTRLWRDAASVFVYVSVPPEPDTRVILETALASGKTLCVPRIYPGCRMKAHIITALSELKPGRYGIYEPSASAPVMDDCELAVIPCVACDESGNRLGRGKGYYDRYLALHPCPALCLCREEAVLKTLPADENDVKPTGIITENRIIYG